MSFFSQKKKTTSQLRPLSENEIQKKLYGNLRPELLDRPRSGHAAEPPQQQPLSFSQPAVLIKESKEVSEQLAASPARDLFESPSRDVLGGVQPHEIPQINKKEKSSEKNRFDRLAQLAEIEKPAKKPFREDPWKKKGMFPSFNFSGAGKFAQGVGGKTAGALGSAGKGALGVFVVAVAFFLRLLQSFDLRKPAVRRVIYWVAGAAALFSIFMGIHLLNVRREEAMKAPPKAESRAVKKEAAAQKAAAAETKKAATVPAKASEALRPASTQTSSTAAAKNEQAQAAVPVKETEAAVSTAGAAGRYVIQIATFAGPNDAERVQKTLKAAELPVFVKALTRPSGRVYYSVFMGRYASFDDAQEGFDLFRKNESAKGFQDAFIRTID